VNRVSLLGGVFVWTELVWTLCHVAVHCPRASEKADRINTKVLTNNCNPTCATYILEDIETTFSASWYIKLTQAMESVYILDRFFSIY
jgi:hypothetical protein